MSGTATDPIFSRTIKTSDGETFNTFTYHKPTKLVCNLCNCPTTSYKILLDHLRGRRHLIALRRPGVTEYGGETATEPPQKKPKLETPPAKAAEPKPNPVVAAKQQPIPVAAVKQQPIPVSAVKQPISVVGQNNKVTGSNLPGTVAKLLDIQKELSKEPEQQPQLTATIPLKLPTKPIQNTPKVTATPTPVATVIPEIKPKPVALTAAATLQSKPKTPVTEVIKTKPPVTESTKVTRTKMANGPELFLNLASQSEPLIGLEYLVELHLYDTEPRYHCVLCDKMGDPRTILIHLTSTLHRMKYFDKHYPSVMKELGELRYDKEARVAVIKILEEVANAVEKYHGRMQPLVMEEGHYKGDRLRYLQQIINGKHFSEFVGPSFVQLVDRKKIANITRTAKLKADVQRKVAEVEAAQRGRSRSRSVSPARRSNRYSSDRRRRSRTPERRDRREDDEKLAKYSSMKVTAVKEVETRYQEFELHPEKHPLYPAEWEAFWNRRYKELQTEGKDASTYDFKPEWIAFWIRRLKELFNSDVEAAKRDIKIKLGLPPQASPSRSTSIESGSRGRDRERERERDRDRKRRSSVDGGWSGDDRDSSKRNRRDRSPSESSRGRGSARRVSRSPSRSTGQSKRRLSRSPSLDRRERIRELDRIISRLPRSGGGGGSSEYARGSEAFDYDYNYSRDRERYRVPSSSTVTYDRDESSSSAGAVITIEDDDDNEPVTVVSVLRILAALEEQLGSMGAKTLEMLAKALAMEKAKPNSSDDLMMSDNNAVFFETIKEKLKGQLITGVLNKSKVNAAKKAVRKIAEILHLISKKVEKAAQEEKTKESLKRTIVIKVNMDKAMIAQRIALALVTEKKTDVTPEQLEILINVFFEMLRKSKELNKMTTTQDYIDLLEEQRVQNVAEQVDILGIIGKNVPSSPSSARKSDKPVVKLDFDDGEGAEASADVSSGAKKVVVSEDNLFGYDEEAEDEEEGFAKAAQGGDGFSDSDLQTLLVNFKDLSSDEQQHLIRHMKRLETEAPERVEKLKRFVNFDGGDGRKNSGSGGGGRGAGGASKTTPLKMSEELSKRRNRWSETATAGSGSPAAATATTSSKGAAVPATTSSSSTSSSMRATPTATAASSSSSTASPSFAAGVAKEEKVKFDMKKKETTIQPLALLGDDDDDDDDDYSFDDVVKAASKNLEGNKGTTEVNGKGGGGGKEAGGARKERSVSPETKRISETHSLIANIMGSLQKKTAAASAAATGTAVAGGKPVSGAPVGNVKQLVGGSTPVAAAAGGSGGGGNKGAAAVNANAGSLPFYQQQSSSYKSTYQEQIQYQQQQYNMQMQQGGYDMQQQQQQQMMYQQGNGQGGGDGGGGGQWWPNQQQQNQMFNQQQQFYGNNNYGGPNQYPNNGQNNYGNYY